MKRLSAFENFTPLFILEVNAPETEKSYLADIGIRPESIITLIKNPILSHSSTPFLVEVHDARFMIDQSLADYIFATHALEDQQIIFKGNKTPQRTAILEVLKSFSHHFTLQELTQEVQKQFPEMGTITIYRSLKTLLEKQVVEEIDLPNERTKYEVKKGHHEHIFCQNCGNIIEFYNAQMEALQDEIMAEHGCRLLSHNVTLIASQCPQCDIV